jgi:ribosomal-protein-alanine N-acetyltransferase
MPGTIEIKTLRLVLRKFTMDDAEAMFNNWASDPEVTRYVTWDAHPNIDMTKRITSSWIEKYEKDPETTYEWCVTLDGEPVGSIGGPKINEHLKEIEFGYCFGKKFWGNGYATESLQAVIDYWFSLGFNRIKGVHHIDNPASGRVMQKCGLQYEGLIRQGCVSLDGTIYDVKQYAIMRSDVE